MISSPRLSKHKFFRILEVEMWFLSAGLFNESSRLNFLIRVTISDDSKPVYREHIEKKRFTLETLFKEGFGHCLPYIESCTPLMSAVITVVTVLLDLSIGYSASLFSLQAPHPRITLTETLNRTILIRLSSAFHIRRLTIHSQEQRIIIISPKRARVWSLRCVRWSLPLRVNIRRPDRLI